jgi:hypothetical protein
MMCAHNRRVHHLQCRLSDTAAGERLEDHIPDTAVGPASELPKDRIPVSELLRQIAPRRTGSHQPKHCVEYAAMIGRGATTVMGQKRFETLPLFVGHQSANQGCSPQRAALNQFSILASIDLSTRPSLGGATISHPLDGTIGGKEPNRFACPPLLRSMARLNPRYTQG